MVKLSHKSKLRFEDIECYWRLRCEMNSNGHIEEGNYSPRIIDMRDVRCGDLSLQLGARYLFCHQGSCEHFLYVTDMRLHHPRADPPIHRDDSNNNSCPFPIVKYMMKARRRRCCICDALSAKVVVYGDRLLETSPSFLCQ